MNIGEIKNNMIPDKIKDICRSCESNIFAQNKGCAFRSLGNEYCDYVLEATKIYLDKQQELERYKNIISKIETLVINHNCDTGDIYYKYNGKYLKSELKDRILELLELKGE